MLNVDLLLAYCINIFLSRYDFLIERIFNRVMHLSFCVLIRHCEWMQFIHNYMYISISVGDQSKKKFRNFLSETLLRNWSDSALIQSTPDYSNLLGKSKKVGVIGSSSRKEFKANGRK